MSDLSAVPAHIRDTTGRFCPAEGQMARAGRCPLGCDHADHYTNDGHPECANEDVARFEFTASGRRKIDAVLARNRNRQAPK